MKHFLTAARLLALDLASTLVFLVLFLLTHNTALSVGIGIAFGVVQIGLQITRGKRIDTMEWLSLFLVVTAGTATLLTNDPRFVLFKPSVIYAIVGVVMLKPGWLNRYLPAIAQKVVPDVAVKVGYVWSADVRLRRGERLRRADLRDHDLGRRDADLRHRQQDRGVPRRLCRAPPHRKASHPRHARSRARSRARARGGSGGPRCRNGGSHAVREWLTKQTTARRNHFAGRTKKS